jgi:hypothetical protein
MHELIRCGFMAKNNKKGVLLLDGASNARIISLWLCGKKIKKAINK